MVARLPEGCAIQTRRQPRSAKFALASANHDQLTDEIESVSGLTVIDDPDNERRSGRRMSMPR